MQILNKNTMKPEIGFDDSIETIGIVVKTAEDLGYPALGVMVPKFMSGYEFTSNIDIKKDITAPVSNKKCINEEKSFIDSNVIIKNYLIVRPMLNQNQSMPIYNVGDKVIVKMIDNDIKTLYFLPYSINRLGQRAVDTYLIAIPSNQKDNTALTDQNTYYIKLDSIEQKITISSSKENGEVCAQALEFDSKNGIITITDDIKKQERVFLIDTKNDIVVTKTSGSTIKQSGDTIDILADVININGETSVNIKTETLNIGSDTINSKANDTTYEYRNFKQSSTDGKWEVRSESHNGTSVSFKGSTFHVNIPTIGLNGQVVFPNFVIGAIPNINIPTPPLSGTSGPKNSMILQTDPAGMPLAKAAPVIGAISALAVLIDTKLLPIPPGAAVQTVSSLLSQIPSTKILSS